MAYGTVSRCRRAFLLSYFGERFGAENCGGCDACRQSIEALSFTKEGTDPLLAMKILSGLARLGGRFGQSMAAKMLAGSKDSKIESFRLHRLSTYGLLSDFSQGQIEKWIQELLGHGCLSQTRIVMGGKPYPVLTLTPFGREVMKGKEKAPLSPLPSPARAERGAGEEEFREGIFDELRRLRSQLAGRESLPPYCIFHDRTLKEMARSLPDTPQKMMDIVGVGEVTFKKYGKEFLDLISSHRSKEKNISREGGF